MAPRYLRDKGPGILSNGYQIVPITPGTKFPTIDEWETVKVTHKRVDRWLSNGHARDGVGIRTQFFPFLDIDILHKKTMRMVVREARDRIGAAPLRWGNRPKCGLLYRTSDPFTKVQSKAWKDPNGRKAQVEFLGDGQQFVAFAIHPDIKLPYEWEDGSPEDMPADDLTIVDEDEAAAFCQWFDEWAESEGWERWKRKKKSTALSTRARSGDDYTDEPCGLTIEQVRDWLDRLPNDDTVEYEDTDFDADEPNYRNVIFATWHETQGSDEGREAALAWSEKSTKHEQEEGRFAKLWNSADHEGKENPVTFRYVIRLVTTQEEAERIEMRESHLSSLRTCTDYDDLKKLTKEIAKTQFDPADSELLATEVKSSFNRITGKTLPIAEARKMIYHEPTEDEIPSWLEPYVYILHGHLIYNKENGAFVEPKSFDLAYSRYTAGQSAVAFAMNRAKIPTYFIPMYKPDDDEDFWFQGKHCLNTFRENTMPPVPERYTKGGRKAVELVEAHLEMMVSAEFERRMFLSWLAHIVQKLERPNWAVVLQGVEGDGKSFWGDLMAAVLGDTNVQKLDPSTIEATHTGWAQGFLLAVIEELRFHGHNRYDIMNKMKPYVTNQAITVHPKNVNAYTALNTQAYMATTNYQDALPIDDNDRRWFILMSEWQNAAEFQERVGDETAYFERLYTALNNHAGALRKWLMEYELHPQFKAKGRAPHSRGRTEMIEQSKSPAQLAFEEIVENDDHPMISRDLVVSNVMIEEVADRAKGELLTNRQFTGLLSRAGYKKLDQRMRLPMVETENDSKCSIWVRHPDKFGIDMSVQRQKVVKFIGVRTRRLRMRDTL